MRQILVIFLLLASCQPQEEGKVIRIVEVQGKVTGLDIPLSLLADTDKANLSVSLADLEVPMLGKFETTDSSILFIPVVPLTRGMTYEVRAGGHPVGKMTIPVGEAPAPELIAIYPLQDTVPENLLKVYLRFSQPMMESRSASFVHLLKDGQDTMKGTFLDLQPELWNEDGTVLTLWLDPGRIKLDLIPNKELGNPLTRGARYELLVGAGWKSKEGKAMQQPFRKSFFVDERDDKSPDISSWNLELPSAGTKDPLRVYFGESLDRMLVEETIRVIDSEKHPISGTWVVEKEDATWEMKPDTQWAVGTYYLTVEGRLEDLAGNNMNRLFETDLSKTRQNREPRASYARLFKVK